MVLYHQGGWDDLWELILYHSRHVPTTAFTVSWEEQLRFKVDQRPDRCLSKY